MKLWRTLLAILVIGAAFFFMGRSLYRNWSQVQGYFATLHFKWALLPVPFALYALSFLILAIAWKEVLAVLGEKIRLGRAAWIVIYSQFGSTCRAKSGRSWAGSTWPGKTESRSATAR